jgi:hypothetical protein
MVQSVQAGTKSKKRCEISSECKRSTPIYNSETLQNKKNPYLRRSSSEKQLRYLVRPERSPCASKTSGLIGNTIYANYFHISGDIFRPQWCFLSIHMMVIKSQRRSSKKIPPHITNFLQYQGIIFFLFMLKSIKAYQTKISEKPEFIIRVVVNN